MPGRNEPCPCGSGKKFKRCCVDARVRGSTLRLVEPALSDPLRAAAGLHALDEELVKRLFAFAKTLNGFAPLEDFPIDLEHEPEAISIFVSWAVYEHSFGGATIVERFLRASSGALRRDEHAWLSAQARSRLSAWEVLDVERGQSIRVRDMFTSEEALVVERMGSESLVPRDVLLARVVTHDGSAVFCGMHPRALGPREASELVAQVRRVLAGRRNAKLTADDLRRPGASTLVLALWQDAFEAIAHAPPPRLQNTDGEDLVLVTDTFTITGNRAALREALLRLPLATLKDDEVEGADAAEVRIAFVRENRSGAALENTVLGHVTLDSRTLVVATNSRSRADSMRIQIARACEGLVAHARREERDGQELVANAGQRPSSNASSRPRSEGPPPELRAVARAWKSAHYARWVDEPIPALGGLTPRAASTSRSKPIRAELETLLKELERSESRLPEEERFDIAVLRSELAVVERPAPRTRPRG